LLGAVVLTDSSDYERKRARLQTVRNCSWWEWLEFAIGHQCVRVEEIKRTGVIGTVRNLSPGLSTCKTKLARPMKIRSFDDVKK